jgi:xylan 1,4-beta-xylosidase
MIENPVIRGFAPDPSLIRVEDDFYIATSTFEWFPGINLYHSKDLENWTQIQSPLDGNGLSEMEGNPLNGGIWAPCLSYFNGQYFLVYTDTKTQKHQFYNTHNYLTWADTINGPWHERVYLHSYGFDPFIFHEKNKKYIISMRNGFKGIILQEFDWERKMLIGEPKTIFEGTQNGFTEGPALYKIGSFYYLLTAEGGTSYNHCVSVARSKNLFGPYEVDPNNPILTTRGTPTYPLQKAGHASMVHLKDDIWLMAYLCARPIRGKCVLGRETGLQLIRLNKKGWFETEHNQKLPELTFSSPFLVQKVSPTNKIEEIDDFVDGIPPSYKTFRKAIDGIYKLEPSGVRLCGKESINSLFTVALLAKSQSEWRQSVETRLHFVPTIEEHAAGVAYIYNNENFYLLIKTLDEYGDLVIRLWKQEKGTAWKLEAEVPIKSQDIYLKVDIQYLEADFLFSYDGQKWECIKKKLDISFISDEETRGFTGAHFALYCHDLSGFNHPSDFHYVKTITYKEESYRE